MKLNNNNCLSICLYGSHLFRCDNRPCNIGVRGTTKELLSFLIVNVGREVRRELIAEQLWTNSNKSRQLSALNSAIWRLNNKLHDFAGVSILVTDSTICLMLEDGIRIDTHMLSQLVHEGANGLSETQANTLDIILQQTNDSFMSGDVPDWALADQERALNIRLRGLTLLMHWYGDNRQYEDALETGRELIKSDPLRETVQIDMMWLYVLNGQRASALKHYQAYEKLLDKELSIDPMPETRALYDHIRYDLNSEFTNLNVNKSSVNNINDSSVQLEQRNKLNLMLESIELSRRETYQTLRTQLGSS